jgi:2-polyprenyl-3-methyl-5-hydroxy-6-metoxy-1,4-benzoquinol methylase
MTPDGTSKAPQIVQFVERTACPCCAGTAARSLWSGRFSDPDVAGYMAQFHYNADLVAELGDQRFDLLRCDACGMTYHRLVVADASVPKVYGSWTDAGQVARFEAAHTRKRSDPFEASVLRVKLVLRLRHLVQQRIPDAAPIRLMDFGCGDGEVLGAARALGMQAIGIDISASRADAARVSGGLVYPDLAAFDDLGGGKVHAVVLSQVLEHVTDPVGLLQQVAKRLLPGGGLFVAVPNCAGLSVPRSFDEFHHLQPLEHLNAFTPESLRKVAARAGFAPLRRPTAVVSTRLPAMLRALVNLVHQPDTTDQFFRLGQTPD